MLPGRERRRNQGDGRDRRHRHGFGRRQVGRSADARRRRQVDQDGRAPHERRHVRLDVGGRAEGLCLRPHRVRLAQEPAVFRALHVLPRRPGRPPADERRQGRGRSPLEGRQDRILHRLPERRPADLRAQRRDWRAQARVQPQGDLVSCGDFARRHQGRDRGVVSGQSRALRPLRRALHPAHQHQDGERGAADVESRRYADRLCLRRDAPPADLRRRCRDEGEAPPYLEGFAERRPGLGRRRPHHLHHQAGRACPGRGDGSEGRRTVREARDLARQLGASRVVARRPPSRRRARQGAFRRRLRREGRRRRRAAAAVPRRRQLDHPDVD